MIKAIITDIEGTTSSLSFVKDVLFPYARTHLTEYVKAHAQDDVIKAVLADTSKEVGKGLNIEDAIAQFIQWIDEDKKITPLKSLQGLIWEAGYQKGDFKGHVYQDAVDNLRLWQSKGLSLYIYSSGSIYAQKLLFGHTEYGDLTPLFSGYFDTNIGGKREVESYAKIAEQIGFSAEQLLFLSDIKEELDAAKAVGMHTFWLTREGITDTQAVHLQVLNFDAVEV